MKICLLATTLLAIISGHVAAQQQGHLLLNHLRGGGGGRKQQPRLTKTSIKTRDYSNAAAADDVLPPPWRRDGSKSIIMEANEDTLPYGKVNLAPDGLTLAMGYHLGGINGDIRGYTVGTFTYVQKAKKWIPLGKPFEVGGEEDDKQFLMSDTAMGSTCLVLSELRGNFEGDDDNNYSVSGKVHLYKYWDGIKGGFWGKMKPPIESDHKDEKVFFGVAVAVAEQVWNEDVSEIFVAVGSVAETGGRVQVYQYQWDPESSPWSKVGKEIVEEGNPYFGQSIKLNEDGTIMAVLGSYDEDPDDDDDDTNMICLIRVYQLKQDDWKQIGQDITRDGKDDDLACANVELSSDGMTVASGGRMDLGKYSQGRPATGHVRVWSFDTGANEWIKKGVDLDSLILPFSHNNGYTIGGNLGLVSNTAGTQLAVSVCEWTSPKSHITQSMLCYIVTFAWADDAKEWQQVGGPLDLPSTLINAAITPDGSVLAAGMLDQYGQFVAQSFNWRKTNGNNGGKAGTTASASTAA